MLYIKVVDQQTNTVIHRAASVAEKSQNCIHVGFWNVNHFCFSSLKPIRFSFGLTGQLKTAYVKSGLCKCFQQNTACRLSFGLCCFITFSAFNFVKQKVLLVCSLQRKLLSVWQFIQLPSYTAVSMNRMWIVCINLCSHHNRTQLNTNRGFWLQRSPPPTSNQQMIIWKNSAHPFDVSAKMHWGHFGSFLVFTKTPYVGLSFTHLCIWTKSILIWYFQPYCSALSFTSLQQEIISSHLFTVDTRTANHFPPLLMDHWHKSTTLMRLFTKCQIIKGGDSDTASNVAAALYWISSIHLPFHAFSSPLLYTYPSLCVLTKSVCFYL